MEILPPTRRIRDSWYLGTADAIYQNLRFIESSHAEYVAIFGGDHIYKMDYSQMLAFHLESGAIATVAALEVPLKEASSFGIIQVDTDSRIIGFQEKPKDPTPVPHNPEVAFASMGIYTFNTREIVERLKDDAKKAGSSHDFGKDLIPYIVKHGKAVAHRFSASCVRSAQEAEAWIGVGRK